MKLSQIGKSGIWVLMMASTGSLIFNSCSSASHWLGRGLQEKGLEEHVRRAPSSDPGATYIPRDLRQAVREFRTLIQSSDFNQKSCAGVLGSIYDELYRTPASHFDLQKLRPEAQNVLDELWQARVELRKKFIGMTERGKVSPDCVDAVRKAMVAARFVEEYVGEWALSPAEPDPKHFPPAWSGEFPWVIKSPDFETTELRSGDVLLSRGDAFISAAIARIGDVEGQFSHLAMIYVDEETGKKYTIEAHIEIGVVAAPIEKYLADGKVRSTIFRYRGDPHVAHQAAKYMFERASRATAAGANIPYDFHFDLKDDSEIFCAEVLSQGFRVASQGRVELPTFESKMTQKHREFLDDIGMTINSTFAPMDVEVEPRFDMVGEWRDLSRAVETHRKDQVLTAVYSWMQEYHYVLAKSAWTELSASVLVQARKWPIFSSLLKSKFPTNMTPRAMAAQLTISNVAETLFNELTERDEEQRSGTGLWLTPYEMLQKLEKIRAEDYSRWEKWREWETRPPTAANAYKPQPEHPRFHLIFHPVQTD